VTFLKKGETLLGVPGGYVTVFQQGIGMRVVLWQALGRIGVKTMSTIQQGSTIPSAAENDDKKEISRRIETAINPVAMNKPDGYGSSETDCGDRIEFSIKVKENVVVEASFEMRGCNFTLDVARASAALVRGKTIREARKATEPEEIDRSLGGLPEHNFHCAEMASDAMAAALRDAAMHVRDPWRKLYRR